MTTHCLHCSVCEQEFNLNKEWNNHLLTLSHQKPAGNECQGCWWEDPSIRDCCAVLFSSCQITKELAADLVSFFGNKLPEIPNGFRVVKRKPKGCCAAVREQVSGYLIHIDRTIVKTVVKETQGGSVTINGKLVQIKLATDFLELQWKQLFHRVLLPEESHLPPVSSKNADLLKEFNWIISCTVISPANWKKFNILLQLIPTIMTNSNLKVFLFRNYVQGIKFNGTQQVLILLCQANSENSLEPLASAVTTDFIKKSKRIPQISEFSITEALPAKAVPGHCFQFQRGNAKLELSLVTDFWLIQEVQLSRMLDYLCKFDSRLTGVLTLTAFWSNCNKIFFTSEYLRNRDSDVTPALDPVILQWLVVLFMTKESVIPSVRSVMERPHRKLLILGILPNKYFDIGFDDSDEHFLTEWRLGKIQQEQNSNEWIHSVVTLTAAMFRYFSNVLVARRALIIPQDGEVLRTCQMLTRERLKTISLCNQTIMLHPLNDSWRLPFNLKLWRESIRSEMEKAAASLEEFLGGADIKLKEALGHSPGAETITKKKAGRL